MAAAYALLISVGLYRKAWAGAISRFASPARMSISIGMLIAGALVFNYVITSEIFRNAERSHEGP